MLDTTLKQKSVEKDLNSETMELKGHVLMLTRAQEELGQRFAHVSKAHNVAEQLAQKRLDISVDTQIQV